MNLSSPAMVLGVADRVLALAPFLPAGRGALILILGGLVMLPLSLLMSRIGLRPSPTQPSGHSSSVGEMGARTTSLHPSPLRPASATTATSAPAQSWLEFTQPAFPAVQAASGSQWQPAAPAMPAASPVRVASGWAGSAMELALRQAVGGTQLVWAAPGHYVVRLGRCPSCVRRLAGCELERATIERSMASFLHRVRVVERACGQRQRRAGCTFEITGA